MSDLKNPQTDLRKSYSVYLNIGFIAALLFFIGLFNIRFGQHDSHDFTPKEKEVITAEHIEQTIHKNKPVEPPRPQTPLEVTDDVTIEDEIIDLNAELIFDERIELPQPPSEEDIPDDEEIFIIVEQKPGIPGGIRQQINKHLKYPEIAQKAGIEGRVVVQFVVNENGKVVQPVVMRGIGGGCDEAAVRAIQKLNFSPGMQRGRPVKVQMTVSVVFDLQN